VKIFLENPKSTRGDSNCDPFEHDELSPQQDKAQHEIIRQCNFTSADIIDARISCKQSLLYSGEPQSSVNQSTSSDNGQPSHVQRKSYATMLQLIAGSIIGDKVYTQAYEDLHEEVNSADSSPSTNQFATPTLSGIARKVAKVEKKFLDKKQYIAYEIICCTFLLGLIRDGKDSSTQMSRSLGYCLEQDAQATNDLIDELQARGGEYQILMFLTGPAGAGKSTAVKVAQRFCFEFCRSVGNLWSDSTFLFTAYTGSAASLFGGVTIVKHAYIAKKGPLSEADRAAWEDVRILIIDEISFMKDRELMLLDNRLKEMGDRSKPFGGFSIIFAGDFRQLEPNRASHSDLLFSSQSSGHFVNSINAHIILDNNHRFQDDKEYGALLKRFWKGDLTKKDRERLNTRVVGQNGLTLPPTFDGDACYACPTNVERNCISAASFKKHVTSTHPSVESNDDPPDHTIVIYANITHAKSKKCKVRRIDNVLRHRIITSCGDAHVKVGKSKKIDPALCLYVGAYLQCVVDNACLNERVPRGNGTLCRLVSIKMKDQPTTHRWRNCYGKKVWWVCATDVEWIEVELAPKPKSIIDQERLIKRLKKKIKKLTKNGVDASIMRLKETLASKEANLKNDNVNQRFRMTPEVFTPDVTVRPHRFATTPMKFRCTMTQFPVNLNDATTGHKLQGMSKDFVIVTSWPKGGMAKWFKNWEYVVLSRVRKLAGLYLLEAIDPEQSFKPTEEFQRYLRIIKMKEKRLYKKIEMRKAKLAKKRQLNQS